MDHGGIRGDHVNNNQHCGIYAGCWASYKDFAESSTQSSRSTMASPLPTSTPPTWMLRRPRAMSTLTCPCPPLLSDAVGVKFVKTNEADFAAEFGIENFPAILYFENQQPSIYNGDAAEETELLTWLLYQMKEDTIENINRELLTKMIDEFEFLALFFYNATEDCTKVLRQLELIDDEAGQYGVRMVKIDDPRMSKKYGHRNPPGLGYFRKGNYIKFDGDLYDDEEMLDWLTDPNVMEISDQIEKVNKKMFEKLITRNKFLTVFFYSDTDCKQCDGVL